MAKREAAWDRLEKAYANEERVEGAIFGRVKGGFTVDLGGAVAFLPGSARSMCARCATPAR
jgi:small subunit ribosomal protein S1